MGGGRPQGVVPTLATKRGCANSDTPSFSFVGREDYLTAVGREDYLTTVGREDYLTTVGEEDYLTTYFLPLTV